MSWLRLAPEKSFPDAGDEVKADGYACRREHNILQEEIFCISCCCLYLFYNCFLRPQHFVVNLDFALPNLFQAFDFGGIRHALWLLWWIEKNTDNFTHGWVDNEMPLQHKDENKQCQ